MTAARIHLVRHGEVHNPRRVLYERIAGYRLSEAGRLMARVAAEHVQSLGRPVSALVCSPLERTRESAEPFAEIFGLVAQPDERVVEPWNAFAGKVMRRAVLRPWNWPHLMRPSVPSWGEPYALIAARMREAMDELWHEHDDDVVVVSHQAPIWIAHLSVAGLPLRHDPRTRRCALSSVTSFERVGDVWREVDYAEPATHERSIDVGAV